MQIKTERNRIAACLYGGALGDALGYEIEFNPWSSIQMLYGENGIDAPVMHDGKARVSDDTQMTLFTAEGMGFRMFHKDKLGKSARVEHYVYHAYLCWLKTQGIRANTPLESCSELLKNPDMHCRRAPGNTCLSALRSGEMGTLDEPINDSKGCGGVMRAAPLGFIRGNRNQQSLFGSPLENGAKVAALTHGHPLGWLPAAMLADTVERCIYEHYHSLRDVIADSLEATVAHFGQEVYVSYFEELMRRAIALAEENRSEPFDIAGVDEPAVSSLGEGWVGEEALAIAVYAALRYPDDLKKALCVAVNHGGDSDSTGAVAGNILGAWLGMDGIPRDWLAQLELTEEIEKLADMMQRVIEG